MAKKPTEKIDPRFDPAFQRGYRPKPGETIAVATRVPTEPDQARPRATVGPRTEARTSTNVDESMAVPASALTAPNPFVPGAQPVGDIELDDEPELRVNEYGDLDIDQSEEDLSDQRDPFVVGLWIIGVTLSLVGLGILIAAVYALVSSSPIQAYDRTMDELGVYTSAPLMTVGLATIVGLLFLASVRSHGRRKRSSDRDRASDRD